MRAKIFIVSLIISANIIKCEEFVLLKVLALSRHSIRTPLAYNLEKITPKTWPEWSEADGYLTQKGVTVEGYMGEYFHKWLTALKLLSPGCPKEEEVFIYANTKERTLASAKAFTAEAFPKCNVTVHRHEATEDDEMDPIFNPILHNNTQAFKDSVIQEMNLHLKTLTLEKPYKELQRILDFQNSDMCKFENLCDLTNDANRPMVSKQKVKVSGPLRIGNSAIDAFLMAYYEGLSMKNVAWSQLSKKSQWSTLLELNRAYHSVLFNNTLGSIDIARPLLKLMAEKLLDNENPKFTLLMGHDANVYTVLKSLGFKPYKLENQQETTPIGGKIVFQKWESVTSGTSYLRINYVYQSSKQLRKGFKLSLREPPQSHLLELNDCNMTKQGICPWDQFEKILRSF